MDLLYILLIVTIISMMHDIAKYIYIYICIICISLIDRQRELQVSCSRSPAGPLSFVGVPVSSDVVQLRVAPWSVPNGFSARAPDLGASGDVDLAGDAIGPLGHLKSRGIGLHPLLQEVHLSHSPQ